MRNAFAKILIAVCTAALLLAGCSKKEPVTEEIPTEEPAEVLLPVEKIPTSITIAGEYKEDCFKRDGYFLSYEDDKYYSEQGIDVSSYTGEVDWQKVKASGIDFVFIRLGYRGYTEGGINLDSHYQVNMKGAEEAGLKIGVYFFSQAINEDEAREEAEFVLENLEGYKLRLPVVYDPEHVESENARTNEVTGEQFTNNTHAFCDVIREAGYEPAVYCNTAWQNNVLDMSRLKDVAVWFAGYTAIPETEYHFEFWQYASKGRVDGISEDIDVDMDIRMIPKRP